LVEIVIGINGENGDLNNNPFQREFRSSSSNQKIQQQLQSENSAVASAAIRKFSSSSSSSNSNQKIQQQQSENQYFCLFPRAAAMARVTLAAIKSCLACEFRLKT